MEHWKKNATTNIFIQNDTTMRKDFCKKCLVNREKLF